jgi:hypothetical protein
LDILLTVLGIFVVSIVLTLGVLAYHLSRGPQSLRLKCTDCNHCKKKSVKTGKGGKGPSTYISTFCYLLQKDLAPDSRCIIANKKKAMYEDDGKI